MKMAEMNPQTLINQYLSNIKNIMIASQAQSEYILVFPRECSQGGDKRCRAVCVGYQPPVFNV